MEKFNQYLFFADEFSIEPRIKESILEEINANGFAPKQFTSSAQLKEKKVNKNIVIDITADTIQVPPATNPPMTSESIFHNSVSCSIIIISISFYIYSNILFKTIIFHRLLWTKKCVLTNG